MVAANPEGEEETGPLRLEFDRTVKLTFRGSSISSDAGLLLHRELDDALGLTDLAANLIADPRTGKNGRHCLTGMLRQSIVSRLAGYEDVNDADRLRLDPVMRQLVGGRAVTRGAASASAMGRFETAMLTRPENLAVLADLPGRWIDAVHDRQPLWVVTLDMDSSESPVHGDQEGAAWNGHFQSKCLHPLFVFNQFGDLEQCALRPGNVHSAHGWEEVLRPVLARYSTASRPSITRRQFRADAAFAIPALFDLLGLSNPRSGNSAASGSRILAFPLEVGLRVEAHFSSISTRTALTRRSSASSPGKTLTLRVRRFSSCWTERSIGFDVRSRFRWCSGSVKTARPSGTFSSSQAASLGAVSRWLATSSVRAVSALARSSAVQIDFSCLPMRLRISVFGA